MKRVMVMAAVVLLGYGSGALATPGHGGRHGADLGRGVHPEGGTITFDSGRETVVFTVTLEPGASSGWHRHPGGVVVVVKSGTLTSFGLDRAPCVGEDVPTGGAYFEDDAANARWPHFVRNRGDVPTEFIVTAFNVPRGEAAGFDADAPQECSDPT